jgi:large subunit ribosomal protein L6
MSRIGNKPVALPKGVDVNIGPEGVRVKGPKGTLLTPLPAGIKFEKKDGALVATRQNDEQAALHGLARSLVANAVHGVSNGFQKELDIVGLGYKAENKGKKTVVFTLGFSHPIEFPLPDGIQVNVGLVEKQTRLTITGADKQMVGQVAANMRSLRSPDPYKQKGIRYVGERLKKKAGKTTGGTSGAK